jgi:8-oxo-dGTP pyrophosphatase MutT (NUDIX family)
MNTSNPTSSPFFRSVAGFLRKHTWLGIPLYVIVRFFRPKYSLGAVGVIFNTQGQVLLVEHVFHPKTPWGLPGGWVNRREDPATTVIRELQEELSITVTVERIVAVQSLTHNHLDLAYLCHTSEPIGKLSNELLAFEWFDIDKMPRILSFHFLAIQQARQFFQ